MELDPPLAPPQWQTSSEAYYGRRAPPHTYPRRGLAGLAFESHVGGYGSPPKSMQLGAAYNPWARSSDVIGAHTRGASPPRARAHRTATESPANTPSSAVDALGAVDLDAERARAAQRVTPALTSASDDFDPSVLRPDTAVREHIQNPHVLITRSIYNPM